MTTNHARIQLALACIEQGNPDLAERLVRVVAQSIRAGAR